MKKTLLKKLVKGASVTLLASVMMCGASLNTNASADKVNNSAAYEEKGIKNGQYNSHKLGAVAPKAVAKNNNGKPSKKATKHSKKNGKKVITKKTTNKPSTKKSGKTLAKKVTKKPSKKFNKKASNKKYNKKPSKKVNKKVSTKPLNKKLSKKYNKTNVKYYTLAKKVNEKKMSIDLKKAKFDQKKGYKKAAKNVLQHYYNLKKFVKFDQQQLNLAK